MSWKDIYKKDLQGWSPEQIAFVDSVYKLCQDNYENGGDVVVETFEPAEIVKTFKTLKDVKEYCGLRVEQELNTRWGEDSDSQVQTAKNYENWQDIGGEG